MPNFDVLPAEIAALVALFANKQRELLALRCASRSCKDAVLRAAEQYKKKDYSFDSRSSALKIAAMGRVFGSACQKLTFGGLKSEECVSALQNFVTSTKGQLRYLYWASGGDCLCSMSALLEMCRASPLLTTFKAYNLDAANLDDFASAVSSACPLLDCVELPSPRSPAEDYQWHFPRSKRLDFDSGMTYGEPICYDNVELTLRSCVHAVEIDFGGDTTVTSRLVDLVLGAPAASRLKSLLIGVLPGDYITVGQAPELILRLASGLGALSNLKLPHDFDAQFFRSLVLARPTIVKFDLGLCNIDNESLKIICEGLRLEHLDISYCKDNGTFPPSAVDIRLAGPFAVEAIVESPSAQTLRSIDITHLPFLPEEMLQLLRGCPKLAELEWENPEDYWFDNSFSPIQDGPAVDALNALLKSRGCRPIDYFFDHYGPDYSLHVGGGAVDWRTGEVFRVVGRPEGWGWEGGWWTVQAPGASEPLTRRSSSLTPRPLPPDDDDDNGAVLVSS